MKFALEKNQGVPTGLPDLSTAGKFAELPSERFSFLSEELAQPLAVNPCKARFRLD